MPIVKTTDDEKKYLRGIWAVHNFNSDKLAWHYRQKYGPKTISSRRIRSYINAWKKNAEPSQDIPVDWLDIDALVDHGVRGHHIHKLGSIEAWTKRKFHEVDHLVEPTTIRNLKWQSYVMTMAPSITEKLDIWVLGEMLSGRDRVSERTNDSSGMDDIVAYLQYKPFGSEHLANKYWGAVKEGMVPQIESELLKTNISMAPLIRENKNVKIFKWVAAAHLFHGWSANAKYNEWDLPTQKYKGSSLYWLNLGAPSQQTNDDGSQQSNTVNFGEFDLDDYNKINEVPDIKPIVYKLSLIHI